MPTPSLFDGIEGYHGDPPAQPHSPTSVAAADGIAPVAGRLRQRVYAHLLTCGERGATDEEMQEALGMPASTQRPRRVELVGAGRVRDSGTTRKTRSGRNAVVWVAVPEAELTASCPAHSGHHA